MINIPTICANAAKRVAKNELLQCEPDWESQPFGQWRDNVLNALQPPVNAKFETLVLFDKAKVAAFKRWANDFRLTELHGSHDSVLVDGSTRRASYAESVSTALQDGSSSPVRYGTDGSHCQLDKNKFSTTAAVVGTATGAIRLSNVQFTTPLHGEMMAVVAALQHLRDHLREAKEAEIVTDSLNTIATIRDLLEGGPFSPGHIGKSRPAAEVWRWLVQEIEQMRERGVVASARSKPYWRADT